MVVLVALSLLAVAWAALRPLVWGLDLLLLSLLCVDWFRTPWPGLLLVDRDAPVRVGLDNEFTRVLRVRAPSEQVALRVAGRTLEVREEFPEDFEVLGRTLPDGLAALAPEDPTGGPDVGLLDATPAGLSLSRSYRGRVRGARELGDLRLRLSSPWGLLQRQCRLTGAQRILVQPALSSLRRTLQLAASERWRDLGVRRLRRRGGMTEFESLRDYVHGDDVRLVDWKAFARRGRPTVREFQVERGQELILLVDCGRRMLQKTAAGEERGWSKLDHALDAALELAAVALQEGDRVGLLAYDSGVRAWVPPRRGARALAELIRAVFDLEPRSVEADLARALREVSILHRRRVFLVVLSDVADPLSVEEQRTVLARAGRRQRIVFAALDDPAVRALASGAEPAGPAASAQRAAALHLCAERRRSLDLLRGTGVRVLDALPAETAGPLLSEWLSARRSAAF